MTDLQQGLGGYAGHFACQHQQRSKQLLPPFAGSNFAPRADQGYTAKTAYPMNVFRANPYTNTLNYQDDNANSNYNALQIDVRHAVRQGLVMAG